MDFLRTPIRVLTFMSAYWPNPAKKDDRGSLDVAARLLQLGIFLSEGSAERGVSGWSCRAPIPEPFGYHPHIEPEASVATTAWLLNRKIKRRQATLQMPLERGSRAVQIAGDFVE